jgi:hypothetical protein
LFWDEVDVVVFCRLLVVGIGMLVGGFQGLCRWCVGLSLKWKRLKKQTSTLAIDCVGAL